MTKLVVITGGPGAGKTAVLEMARRYLCKHAVILPEAASMVFSGGFWRLPSESARRASQRAIYHVQSEMEELAVGENTWTTALCDRGTLDGLAYWPGDENIFWSQVQSTFKAEMEKYSAVVHLRTPNGDFYNYQNSLRIETPEEARRIDLTIEKIWSQHPHYIQIPNFPNFLDKAQAALKMIEGLLPKCCASLSSPGQPR